MTFSLSHQSLRKTGEVDNVKLSTVREEFKRLISEENIGSSASELSFEIKGDERIGIQALRWAVPEDS